MWALFFATSVASDSGQSSFEFRNCSTNLEIVVIVLLTRVYLLWVPFSLKVEFAFLCLRYCVTAAPLTPRPRLLAPYFPCHLIPPGCPPAVERPCDDCLLDGDFQAASLLEFGH